MDHLTLFWDAISKEMTMTLATSQNGRVTMRLVSPVRCGDSILLFTGPGSAKYRQLEANPRCCVSVGGYFAEAFAAFRGDTMLEENAPLRAAYAAKFPGAFDEDVTFGGRGASFILLRPTRLTGWGFAGGAPTADGVPNEPFEILLP